MATPARRWLLTPGPWLAAVVTAGVAAPNFWWQAHNGWPTLEFASNVPAGQYQVCIQPPIGWGSKVRTTHVLAGWICSPADLRTSPQLVTFRLGNQAPGAGQ